MCGILGLVGKDKVTLLVVEKIKSAGQSIDHCGSDGEGIFINDIT